MSLKPTRLLMTSLAFAGLFSTAGAQQPDQVQIGAPIPITGPYAADGQVMRQALELAVAHLNDGGGINGSEVTLRIFDIGDLTPDKLQAAASELIDRRDVSVLINGYGGMGPDIPAFCNRDLPYLNNNATSEVVTLTERLSCNNIFMAADMDRNYGSTTFDQIQSLGLDFGEQRLAILHGPYDWELGFTTGFEERALSEGWSVAMKTEVPYDTTQWSVTMQQLRAQQPDLIVLETLDPVSARTFFEQFRRTPIAGTKVYAGYLLSTPALGSMIAAGELDGVMGMTLSAHRSSPEGDAFVEAWQAMFGEEPPMSIAAQVYDEVMLWANAATQVGDATDFEMIRDVFMNSDFTGLTGTLSFNEQYYVPVGDSTQPSHLVQAVDGSIVSLVIGTETVRDFSNPSWMQ
jgi:branched-chain amino acid transport system substrate-binding protein